MACTSIACAAPTHGRPATGGFQPRKTRSSLIPPTCIWCRQRTNWLPGFAPFKRGDLVDISGYLIEIKFADNGIWRSSLMRTDTGNGGCELVWVIGVKKLE